MALSLSTAARAHVAYIVDYITKSGSYGLPIDHLTADLLSKHWAEFGFVSQNAVLEGLRDQPTVTLLNVLLHLSDAV